MLERKNQCCENCNAFLKEGRDEGYCRAAPPTPIFMGMGQAAIALAPQAQSQPIIIAHFPKMLSRGWCRAWEQEKT